ncbi:MAG: UDP-N-acetylglucosamine 4,6-dehydratase (inverting) [Candidatus Buchananbacteria bacterium]|nr:UDP-N-acetylglucosamine 4,6-dehydratase (inverting) [Candidatus Buchananbacteria bacterium]
MFDGKTILITGGTGSFGRTFTKYLLDNFNPKKIIIFSRDEFKQHQMNMDFNDQRIRFFIGDVRDLSRLQRALKGVDIVIHASALKQVPAMEYNPFEAIKTNVLGSQNVIEAAIDQQVPKVLLISTDKAAHPINLYGATKLSAEKIFIASNSYAPKKTVFAAVRYGNVIGSRGSVIDLIKRGEFSSEAVKITDPEMTRFWITLRQACELVVFALENMEGGEIFVPKIPSMKIADMFKAVLPKAKQEVIGIRPGEKLHEALLTQDEARHSVELEKYFVILPEFHFFSKDEDLYAKYYDSGKKLEPNFQYTSDKNHDWLTDEQMKDLVKN